MSHRNVRRHRRHRQLVRVRITRRHAADKAPVEKCYGVVKARQERWQNRDQRLCRHSAKERQKDRDIRSQGYLRQNRRCLLKSGKVNVVNAVLTGVRTDDRTAADRSACRALPRPAGAASAAGVCRSDSENYFAPAGRRCIFSRTGACALSAQPAWCGTVARFLRPA